MEASGAVLGVLFALVLVIVISPFATVYVLWKDGCCKRREETVEEEASGQSPSRRATRQNSSLFQYLTRFTDSGRYRNNVVSRPPTSSEVSATRPSYEGSEDRSFSTTDVTDEGLTSEYNRMASPPAVYEVPVDRRRGEYDDVIPRPKNVPKHSGGNSIENSGRYDYVQSDSVRYELGRSTDVIGQTPSSSAAQRGASHYETDASFRAAPPSQHYAISYVTPSSTQSKSFMEASSATCGEQIYKEPAKDRNSLYAQFKDFKIKLIPRDKISITGYLGSGQFGKVQKGIWSSPDHRGGSIAVAVKSLKENSDEISKIKFLQEVAIMGQFSHPNVVKLHGLVSTDEPLMIVIELLLKGDLRNHLISLRKVASETVDSELPSTLLGYCRDIAQGMKYLAKKAFVHRDLAARNILISEEGVCKVADFGMSRELAEADYYVSQGGQIPVKWTAPDALHYRKYSTASDVWSYGCVMYEIWSLGHKPFEAYDNIQAIKMVDKGYRLAPPTGCPKAVYSLMMDCWHPQASERPTFQKICVRLQESDSTLLKWSVRERVDAPNAIKLGAGIKLGAELHKDLQRLYQT